MLCWLQRAVVGEHLVEENSCVERPILFRHRAPGDAGTNLLVQPLHLVVLSPIVAKRVGTGGMACEGHVLSQLARRNLQGLQKLNLCALHSWRRHFLNGCWCRCAESRSRRPPVDRLGAQLLRSPHVSLHVGHHGLLQESPRL